MNIQQVCGRSAFLQRVLLNPHNRSILARLPEIGLKDAWLVSGCVFQTVWNVQTHRPPTYGIKDYDLFYFDDADLSYEAEDQVIKACAEAFGDLGVTVEVRNQARVHLWLPEKFGVLYPQLTCATDGIDNFLHRVSQVGVQALKGGGLELYAPSGIEDVTNMVVRPNPGHGNGAPYEEKARRWKAMWPEARVLPWASDV